MSSQNTMKFEQAESTLSLQPDWAQIDAIYTAAIPKQIESCGLVGRVVRIGEMVTGLNVGDVVIAFAPLKPSIMLTAASCQKIMNSSVITESMAFWAFALALIPAIHLSELELGEQVLVLSNNLVGQMLTELAWLAGAELCVNVDPAYAGSVGHRILSSPSHGPRRMDDLSTLEIISPDSSVDLLIDALGDSAHFQSNLTRVRNHGRALTIGYYSPANFDFNVYPDLHKRSLRLLNYRLPTSLMEFGRGNLQNSSQLSQTLDYVRYLFETGRLDPSIWPLVRLRSPDKDTLIQVLQGTERNTILVEW